jgi:hypothetical protein
LVVGQGRATTDVVRRWMDERGGFVFSFALVLVSTWLFLGGRYGFVARRQEGFVLETSHGCSP